MTMGCEEKHLFALACGCKKSMIDASLSDRDLRNNIVPNIANIFFLLIMCQTLFISTFEY